MKGEEERLDVVLEAGIVIEGCALELKKQQKYTKVIIQSRVPVEAVKWWNSAICHNDSNCLFYLHVHVLLLYFNIKRRFY